MPEWRHRWLVPAYQQEGPCLGFHSGVGGGAGWEGEPCTGRWVERRLCTPSGAGSEPDLPAGIYCREFSPAYCCQLDRRPSKCHQLNSGPTRALPPPCRTPTGPTPPHPRWPPMGPTPSHPHSPPLPTTCCSNGTTSTSAPRWSEPSSRCCRTCPSCRARQVGRRSCARCATLCLVHHVSSRATHSCPAHSCGIPPRCFCNHKPCHPPTHPTPTHPPPSRRPGHA